MFVITFLLYTICFEILFFLLCENPSYLASLKICLFCNFSCYRCTFYRPFLKSCTNRLLWLVLCRKYQLFVALFYNTRNFAFFDLSTILSLIASFKLLFSLPSVSFLSYFLTTFLLPASCETLIFVSSLLCFSSSSS